MKKTDKYDEIGMFKEDMLWFVDSIKPIKKSKKLIRKGRMKEEETLVYKSVWQMTTRKEFWLECRGFRRRIRVALQALFLGKTKMVYYEPLNITTSRAIKNDSKAVKTKKKVVKSIPSR